MKEFAVTPTDGTNKAPTLYVEASDEKAAIEAAKKLSRLGESEAWRFMPRELGKRGYR